MNNNSSGSAAAHTDAALADSSQRPATAARRVSDFSAGLHLVVLREGRTTSHALPRSGAVCVGRSRSAGVPVDDPSVSPRHILFHIGETLQVEDLGSTGGTRLWGRRLEPGRREEARPGDFIEIGTSLIFIQPTHPRQALPAGAVETADLDPMRRLHDVVEKVAPSTLSVLLLGETGVGKGRLAERIHQLSPRCQRPFLQINCAAFPESLLESELFGHEKGAFTGAVQAKPGLLETAQNGTLLLDEVGEIPFSLQAKLLRVLEQREVLRIGALRPRHVDVRLISATNRDLEGEVTRGAFRSDLFFRLEGISLHVPPLRERRGEIEGLANAFAADAGRREGRATPLRVSADALRLLKAYPWPGNVRELRNMMERAVVLCSGLRIEPDHLPLEKIGRSLSEGVHAEEPSRRRKDERERILEALSNCAGNQSRAAHRLGISRRTLISRLDAYDLPRPRKGFSPP